MLLSPEEVAKFVSLYGSLMCFVNQRLHAVPETLDRADAFGSLTIEERHIVRNAFLDHIDLIEAFTQENPFALNVEDQEIVASWRHLVAGEFYYLRQLKKHAIFLSASEPPAAYGVLGEMAPV